MNEPPQQLTDEQFQQQVHTITQRELGLSGLARFITLHHSGTRDRHQSLEGITLQQIFQNMEDLGNAPKHESRKELEGRLVTNRINIKLAAPPWA